MRWPKLLTQRDVSGVVPAPPDVPRGRRRWPLLVIGASAGAATWSGWVGLGGLTGFGPLTPFPGIADHFQINTAITLPIGVEAYAVYALSVATDRIVSDRARRWAWGSTAGALALGITGQISYHVMRAAGITEAPWWITAIVSAVPVLVLGAASLLWHLAGDALGNPILGVAAAAPPALPNEAGRPEGREAGQEEAGRQPNEAGQGGTPNEAPPEAGRQGQEAGGPEGREAPPEEGREAGHEAPEAGANEAPPEPNEAGPARPPRETRQGGTLPTVDDVIAALTDGSLTALSRSQVKARFGLKSNSTADRILKAVREHQESLEPIYG